MSAWDRDRSRSGSERARAAGSGGDKQTHQGEAGTRALVQRMRSELGEELEGGEGGPAGRNRPEGQVSVISWLWEAVEGVGTQENTHFSGSSGWKLKNRKGGKSLCWACPGS